MVKFAQIAKSTESGASDLTELFRQLDALAQPIADEPKPLPIIAPAVLEIHNKARDLEFTLSAKRQTDDRLNAIISSAFRRITDYYVIITGISPPADPVERIVYQMEVDFARKMVEMSYDLANSIGGATKGSAQPSELPTGIKAKYAEQIKLLRDKYPVPDFASEKRMRRRGARMGVVGWIIFALFILGQSGLLSEIIKAVANLILEK